MTAPVPTHFTAAQIARARGWTRQRVQQWLGSVPADGVQIVGGQEAQAWKISSLPPRLLSDLQRIARERGFRDVAHLVSDAPAPWTPPRPLSEVPDEFKTQASKLREVLSPFLARQHTLPPRQLIEEGLAAFLRAFGYAIKAKTFLRRMDLATARDGGAEDWQRLDLYIAEAAFKTPPKPSARQSWSHAELMDSFDQVTNKAKPTHEDRAYLFHDVFTHFEQLSQAHAGKGTEIKNSIVAHLLAVFPPPAFARTTSALKRQFEYKLIQWRDGGRTPEALSDGRPLKSGNFRTPDFSADLREIAKLAVRLDGNEELAHAMLRERGQLSPAYCEYRPFNPRDKNSRLARTDREMVTPMVEVAKELRHSQRAFSLAGPSTDRDWSGDLPGDWFTADDVTWNHLYRVRNTNGGWDVLRGECLVMTDAKSDYPLDFLLIAGHYNSEHIRQLMLRAHDTVGLPRKGFLFERGVWSSRLIKGVAKAALHWRDTAQALRSRLDLDIRHTYTPRGKPIEGVFRRVQERMRCIAGFVGFNEMVEKREDVQKLIARARRGDEEALAFFPTQEEWRDGIRAVLDDFQHSPSKGNRIPTLSPAEAWKGALLDHPLRQLTPDERFLMATHCERIRFTPRLGRKGIVLTIRGQRRTFANEHTGAWYHAGVQEALAFYNVEEPDLLTVSDIHRQQFFTVKQLRLPAMSATREQLAEVAKAKRDHLAPARAIFGEIKHEVVSRITRDAEHDEETKELGRFHNAAVEAHRQEESEEQKLRREINRLTDALGAPRTDFASLRVSLRQKRDALKWKVDVRERNTREPSATP